MTDSRAHKLRNALGQYKKLDSTHQKTTATYLGAALSIATLPIVLTLTLYFAANVLASPFTLITNTIVTEALVPAADDAPATLDLTCRAPAGCLYATRYTERGPTASCVAKGRKNQNWRFVPYGTRFKPFACYSPLYSDGIFVAWLRFPPQHMCAVRFPNTSSAALRRRCEEDVLLAADASGWSSACPNRGAGGSCFETSALWNEYYSPSNQRATRAIMDPTLDCADLSCAEYPFGASMESAGGLQALISMADTGDSSDAAGLDLDTLFGPSTTLFAGDRFCRTLRSRNSSTHAPLEFGSHLVGISRYTLVDFPCGFRPPECTLFGLNCSISTASSIAATSTLVSRSDGYIHPRAIAAHGGTAWATLEPPVSDALTTLPWPGLLLGAIRGLPPQNAWVPADASPLQVLYDSATPRKIFAHLPVVEAFQRQYIADHIVVARLRPQSQLKLTSVVAKDVVTSIASAAGGYLSLVAGAAALFLSVYIGVVRAVQERRGRDSQRGAVLSSEGERSDKPAGVSSKEPQRRADSADAGVAVLSRRV